MRVDPHRPDASDRSTSDTSATAIAAVGGRSGPRPVSRRPRTAAERCARSYTAVPPGPSIDWLSRPATTGAPSRSHHSPTTASWRTGASTALRLDHRRRRWHGCPLAEPRRPHLHLHAPRRAALLRWQSGPPRGLPHLTGAFPAGDARLAAPVLRRDSRSPPLRAATGRCDLSAGIVTDRGPARSPFTSPAPTAISCTS